MMKTGQGMVAVLAAGWLAVGSGCVGLDEHRQLQMSHRTLGAEKEQLEQELYDARNNNDSLRTRLAASEDKLGSKERLVANLESENNNLEQAVLSARELANKIAEQSAPGNVVVVERRLPAELDTALKDFAAQYPSSVYYDQQRGIIKWTSDLVFALGSDIVKDSARDSIKGFAEIMNSPAASGFDALIVGHTDNMRISRAATKKKHPTNWHLSVHRAISVSSILREYGVAPTRAGVMGFGEFHPIESNDTEAGRSQNRRVEVYIVPANTIGGVVLPQTGEASTEVVMPAATEEEVDGVK